MDNDDSPDIATLRKIHSDSFYLNPRDLGVTTLPLSRVAMIGSCLMERWGVSVPGHPNCVVEFFLVGVLSEMPIWNEVKYDFQVIQIPLRALIPEPTLWHKRYNSPEELDQLFEQVCEQLKWHLNRRMAWNIEHGLLTFVVNFMLPQRNPLGSLLRKYDLANPAYFLEKLNERLEILVRVYKNAYVVDIDQISASIGRRYVQDDNTDILAHGSMLELFAGSEDRIEALPHMKEHYEIKWLPVFRDAIWEELKALHRIVLQADAVKLVVVDLDDTLWRGVSGEMNYICDEIAEGWPIGILEALAFLKRRGVLIAIVSRNEESRIRNIWPKIFRDKFKLDDFAAIRINWRTKVENVREILGDMNLLARSVVFIDDNPAERKSMKMAFPDMRILGRYPFYIRRTLLWAPETQVISITEESGRRTEMVQGQLKREDVRRSVTGEEFLQAACPRVKLLSINAPEHPRFQRAIELINKTNQFNTTGRRWTLPDITTFLREGEITAFDVVDAFADYGLVGVVLTHTNSIVQWVMSCRVLGYKIENAVMAKIVERIRLLRSCTVVGVMTFTDANYACREFFASCSFSKVDSHGDDESWELSVSKVVAVPPHVIVA